MLEAHLGEAALTSKYLDRQIAAVFTGHASPQVFSDGGKQAAVILELLGAILDANSGAFAAVLVVGRFVCVLKATPSADVVNQENREIRAPLMNVGHQQFEGVSAFDS